uniref:glycosyltransferase n=1 Tax=Trichocoleus desertorum TaxID=1481672 RepID=UPI0025B41A96|nr:glycosyltransferase [Trichocoleus desertorum]
MELTSKSAAVIKKIYNHYSEQGRTENLVIDSCYQALKQGSLTPDQYLAYRSISELYTPEINLIQVELEQSQSQLHQTQAELEQSQSQLHQTQAELEQSQSQLHQTQAELEQSQLQLHQTQAELEQSQLQLHQTQAELEQSQSQLHQTQAELEQSQLQLHQTQAELEQSQLQLHQTQAELEQSQLQLHQTQAELEQSQLQLHQTQAELERSNTVTAAMETSKFWKLRTLWFQLKESIPKPLSLRRSKASTHPHHEFRSKQTDADSFITEVSSRQPLVRYSVTVDIIVCVHNALDDVKRCLESVIRYSRMPYSLVLVDDGSGEETCKYLKDFANAQGATRIRNEVAKGYTSAANQGLRLSQGDYAILLNSDTVVTPNWLDRIVACGESDPQIGLIGPLSNTASWQSIPEIVHQGDWADNQLPEGMTIANWAKLVAHYSERLYPRIPFLNGFCLAIKQRVIKELGYFDEATFGEGYGEENDYCLRAFKAGWQLAIADDAYIYHSQSRSYSHERRKLLCARSDKALVVKHGQQIISDNVNVCRFDRAIQGIRAQSQVVAMRQSLIEDGKSRWEGKRVLFILPIIEPGGGGNVVLQEATAMQKMGVDVRIVNLSGHQNTFERSYPQNNIPVIYVEKEHHISGLLPQYDAVIATLYKSVDWLEPLTPDQSLPIRGYYIQDFEPYFFPNNSESFRTACNSYTRYPDLVRITKTEWNRSLVKQKIGVDCSIVGPSVNIDLYRPRRRRDSDWPYRPLRIAAMIRPSTPRRNPKLTLEVLRDIHQAYREDIEIILFGCEADDPNFLALPHDFPWRNAGILTRPQLAFLLNEVDIFVDFSTFQAMGLTAMEAMACGVAAIVPENGGAQSFARHEENSLMVDTNSPEACVTALKRLIIEEPLRSRLQRQAIVDICQHFPEKAAYNTLKSIFPA